MASETKEHIVSTAFKLFLENGYESTSMAQLVQTSNVSKGAFYHYFSSKEEIYDHIIEKYFLGYFKEVDWSALESLSLEEIKQEITRAYQNLLKELIKATENQLSCYFIMFFYNYQRSAEFKNVVQTFYTKMKSLIASKLQASMDNNTAQKEATMFISRLEGLFFWKSVFPGEDIDQYLNN